MNSKTYKELNEVVYSQKLENGLSVQMIPKRDYGSVYAVLFTEFGSNDYIFKARGENEYEIYPHGVAHFLEHKLFETEEGDISQVFSFQGASINAVTSNTKTVYMVSFTANGRLNIETLLDFVQMPTFDQQSVEDEKSIITQEILMYKDDPDWVLAQGLLENLYPAHPIRIDVAGTPESVQAVTVDMLKKNHENFYHPSNMQIVIVGNIDPEETLQWIESNQEKKAYPKSFEIKRELPTETGRNIIKSRTIHLPVNLPKVLVGVKGVSFDLNEEQAFRHIICMEILLELLFGETSSTYLAMSNKNLIDNSFSYDYIFERGFDYVTIGGDSRLPEVLAEKIKKVLMCTRNNPDMSYDHFVLIKKQLTGEYIQDLNSLGYVAHQFVDMPFRTYTIYDYLSVLKLVTFEDVKQLLVDYFKAERHSVFIVESRINQEIV
ncbi:MAG: pitrilysin family protein [Alkalibacterium sp.]